MGSGGRRLHVAVCESGESASTIVRELVLPPGEDVTIGQLGEATVSVPGWHTPPVRLVTGELLHLAPGMRVNMCGDSGEDRIVGTYDELLAAGITIPIPLCGRRVNVLIRAGVSVFTKYVEG